MFHKYANIKGNIRGKFVMENRGQLKVTHIDIC